MVDIAGFYHKALMTMLRSTRTQAECVEKAESCGSFFVESLSPFEMTYRGHREAQAAMRQLNEGMEAEAKRIAHALHDEAGQLLMSVHFALERLSLLGLVPALQFLAQGVARRSGCEMVVQGSTAERLSPLVEIALYRSVQEALTNVTKHAKASRVTVQIQQQESDKKSVVVCSVKDDGVGFDVGALAGTDAPLGLGLLGIRERIKAVSGSLELKSAPNSGTEVRIHVPLVN